VRDATVSLSWHRREVQALAITGSSGRLGQRLLSVLASAQAAGTTSGLPSRVVAVDRFLATEPVGPDVVLVTADLAVDDLSSVFAGCSTLVHLASDSGGPAGGQDDPALTKRVFEAAAAEGVGHVVVMSSAVVYGARPDNPVPITEAFPAHPNEGFAFARSRLEVEQLAEQWRDAAPVPGTRTLTILRPAVSPSASGTSGWLAEAVFPSRVDQMFTTLPPLQFVHVDDVASAVLHAVVHRLDGVYNVAPDRWLRGEDAPPLLGTPFVIPATGRVWELVSLLARTVVRPLLSVRPRPAGAQPWSRHPWVVANDRLRLTGWVPLSTTEEVLVARRAPSKLHKLFARRRQELTIAAVGTVGLSVAGSVFGLWRRWAGRR
jgi:nucleoside-diphosphate-sugar epimerase